MRLKTPTVCLVFHANKDHSEVSYQRLRKMLEGEDAELLRMLESVNVPINLSTQAEDLLFWQIVNPKIVEALVRKPYIEIMPGLYSHMMPSLFSGMLSRQLRMAGSVINPRNAGPIGCIPEVDVSSSIIHGLDNHRRRWSGVLALEDLHYTYEYRADIDCRIPLTGKTILQSQGMPIVVARAGSLRDTLLKYYRGFATADEFVTALVQVVKESELNFLTFFTDFELSQVNALNGESRLDLWCKLFEALKEAQDDRGIRFATFNDSEIWQFISDTAEQMPETTIEMRPMPKWLGPRELYDKAVEVIDDFLSGHRIIEVSQVLRLTISDTFSAHGVKRMELSVKDSSEKVIIESDRDARVEVFEHYYALATGRKSRNPSNETIRWYLKNLSKVHEVSRE